MKAICISNIDICGKGVFTLGDTYDIDECNSDLFYYIRCDDLGMDRFASKKCFNTLQEIRNNKIEELGI